MPHEYVPWSLGRDFADLGGDPGRSTSRSCPRSPAPRSRSTCSPRTTCRATTARSSAPSAATAPGATWVNRWTAEEGRHAFCIRDYLLVTRGVDPDELERARMETMETGYDSGDKPLLNVCAYVSFQELATRVSHRNTGQVHRRADRREAADPRRQGREPAHDLLPQHRRRRRSSWRPSQTMRAITDEVVELPDAGRDHPGLRPQGRADGDGRHLRPAHPPRRHRHAAAAPVGRLRARGARRRRRGGPRRARRRRRRARRARRPGSSRSATRPRRRRQRAGRSRCRR